MGGCKHTILGGNIGGSEGTLVGGGIIQFWEGTLVGGGIQQFWEETLVGGCKRTFFGENICSTKTLVGDGINPILGRNIFSVIVACSFHLCVLAF